MVDLDGVQHLSRLKRLIVNNNIVSDLSPLQGLRALVEINLENNPVEKWHEVLLAVIDKKDILVLNLKNSKVIMNNYEESINQASLALMESLLVSSELNQRHVDEFKKLLRYQS